MEILKVSDRAQKAEQVSLKPSSSDETPLLTAYPYLPDTDALMDGLKKIIGARWLSNFGHFVMEFERQIAHHLDLVPQNIVSCSNATSGLEVTLRALGLKGKVIVPSFTFVSTANSVVNAGLEVVFADVDPETCCLAPESIESLLKDQVAAVVPVHAFGRLGPLNYYEELRSRGVKVIYDSAHSFGETHDQYKLGALGDAEVFSFHATKIVSACEGGAVATLDLDLAQRLRELTNNGICRDLEIRHIGTNAKLSEVHAMFGLISLQYMREAISKRKKIVEAYHEQLGTTGSVTFLSEQAGLSKNYLYLPVLCSDGRLREHIFSKLMQANIHPRRYFHPPIHKTPAYAGFSKAALPVTEDISSRVLCLPLHAEMTLAHVEHICDVIRMSV